MSHRLTVREDGALVDRGGHVVGRLRSLTVDLDEGLTLGGTRGGEDVRPNSEGSSPQVSLIPEGGAGGDSPDEIEQVWAHYQRVIPNGSRYVLDPKKRTIIRSALRVRPLEDCLRAIDGLAASPHHNGQNDRGKTYLSIHYALQGKGSQSNDERIDAMAEKAATQDTSSLPPEIASLPSDAREMVRARQAQVESGLRNPGDERLVETGREASAWLLERFGLRGYLAAAGEVEWIREVGK